MNERNAMGPPESPLDRVARSALKRREFLLGAGAVGLGGFLAACGGSSSGGTPKASASTNTSSSTGSTSPPKYTVGSTSVTVTGKTNKAPGDLKLRVLTQIAGVPYYQRVGTGMTLAAKALGIGSADITGPASVNSSLQVQTVDSWITQGIDIMILSSTDPVAMGPTINKAVQQGITVLSYDVDAPNSDRALYVNSWDPTKGPQQLWNIFMGLLGTRRGEYAFITTTLTDPEHKGWLDVMEAYQKHHFPTMKLVATEADNGDQTQAVTEVKQIIAAHPNLVGVVSVDAGGTPGAAQAVQELGKTGKIVTTGLSTPSQMKQFVESGAVPKFALWDPGQIGYLATQMAFALINGHNITSGERWPVWSNITRAVPLEPIPNGVGPQAIVGPALVFDKSNINDYPF